MAAFVGGERLDFVEQPRTVGRVMESPNVSFCILIIACSAMLDVYEYVSNLGLNKTVFIFLYGALCVGVFFVMKDGVDEDPHATPIVVRPDDNVKAQLQGEWRRWSEDTAE
eukprot:gene4604-49482_t